MTQIEYNIVNDSDLYLSYTDYTVEDMIKIIGSRPIVSHEYLYKDSMYSLDVVTGIVSTSNYTQGKILDMTEYDELSKGRYTVIAREIIPDCEVDTSIISSAEHINTVYTWVLQYDGTLSLLTMITKGDSLKIELRTHSHSEITDIMNAYEDIDMAMDTLMVRLAL